MSTSTCPHCGQAILLMKSASLTPRTPAPKPAPDPDWDSLGEEPRTAPAKPAAEKTNVELKLVRCNRCGEENLCWQKSKNDKFYLCRAQKNADGTLSALRKEFHKCR